MKSSFESFVNLSDGPPTAAESRWVRNSFKPAVPVRCS